MNNFDLIQAEGAAPILKISGRLDAVSSTSFEMAVEPLLTTTRFLIIDLAPCSYLSSVGIRILLKTHKKMLAAQGKLIITGLLPEVYQVIEMAGLHRIFNLVDTPELASKEIDQLQSDCTEPIHFEHDNRKFQFQSICKEKHPLLFWKGSDMIGCNELGFSIGYGAPAESDDVESLSHGLFLTAGICAGFLPDDSSIPADFRVAPDASKIAVFSLGAISFGEKPSGTITTNEPQLTMQEYITTCQVAKKQQQVTGIAQLVILNRNHNNPSLTIILDFEDEKGKIELWQHIPEFHQHLILKNNNSNHIGLTFKLEELTQTDDTTTVSKFITNHLSIDNIIAVESISADEILHNPFAWLFYSEICHGDLNMQNILLDEHMNVYLIDFSETKPRSAISDFARMEAIFLADNAPLENQEDMDAYLHFIANFYTADSLQDIPAFTYTGLHQEQVQKQVALALKMRKYAFDSVQENPDIIPYYLALLEWILPIVCYYSSTEMHKRLSMF